MYKTLLPAIAAALLASFLLQPSDAPAHGGAMIAEMQDLNARLAKQVVPFTVVDTTGGLCDSAGVGTSNPNLEIDSDGADGEFVVTSILFLTTLPGVPDTGFLGFQVNHVEVDSQRFHTRTGNLLGPTDGPGVYESVDVMGAPVRRSSDSESPIAGGNFPHEIVAESANTDDIHINFFCGTDDDDVSFSAIKVSGWKRPADTITLTFTPGS